VSVGYSQQISAPFGAFPKNNNEVHFVFAGRLAHRGRSDRLDSKQDKKEHEKGYKSKEGAY
jgi:hypothetical protein